MKLITYPTSGSLKNTTSDKAGKFCGSPLRQLGYFTGLANVIASLSISFLFITSPVVSNVHSLEQKYITDPHVSWLPPPDLELLLQTAITSYHSCQTAIPNKQGELHTTFHSSFSSQRCLLQCLWTNHMANLNEHTTLPAAPVGSSPHYLTPFLCSWWGLSPSQENRKILILSTPIPTPQPSIALLLPLQCSFWIIMWSSSAHAE